MSHVTFRLSHVTCYMWNAYVDPLDMLNNFCFLVYAQKWVFVIMSHFACHIAYLRCHIAHFTYHVSCLCWSLVHSEQLLFSGVSSKVIIYNYVTCHMSHVTCHMSHVKCLCWSLGHVDPWDMLNNFCFHVYAQKWVFVITLIDRIIRAARINLRSKCSD